MKKKLIQCGGVRFDRDTIPPEVCDIELWPAVDLQALSDAGRQVYESRRMAVVLYLERDLSLTAIEKKTGVSRTRISYFVERCLQNHSDGRIAGFRALIRFSHLQPYERTESASGKKGIEGLSGAFNQLLRNYPNLKNFLDRKLKKSLKPGKAPKEIGINVPQLHKQFLAQCREAGITDLDYPFNTDYCGRRSLGTYVRNYIQSNYELAAREAGADKTKSTWQGNPRALPIFPYQVVEIDGHKLHLRVTLTIPDPFGLEIQVELSRLWILPVFEVTTRAVLGYYLSLSIEYNADDVVAAFQDALVPRTKHALTIPGLKYREGAGFPHELFPELEYACWDWVRYDNAKAHFADSTLSIMHTVIGCWSDAGPRGEPDQRPFIERFFQLLTANFAHRITGTTGSNTLDIIRELADPNGDTSVLMNLRELEELIEVIFADYNATPHDGLGGRTPLEAMAHYVRKSDQLIRTLARCQRKDLCLLQVNKIVTIRANLKEGVRPHIHYKGVNYSNEILSTNAALVGKKLRIYIKIKDLRTLRAFFDDGAELGVLSAARPWLFTPHDLRLRTEINRLKRLGKIRFGEGDDAIQVYVDYKRQMVKKDKRAANALAKVDRALKTHEPIALPFLPDETSSDSPAEAPTLKTKDVIAKPLTVKRTVLIN